MNKGSQHLKSDKSKFQNAIRYYTKGGVILGLVGSKIFLTIECESHCLLISALEDVGLLCVFKFHVQYF